MSGLKRILLTDTFTHHKSRARLPREAGTDEANRLIAEGVRNRKAEILSFVRRKYRATVNDVMNGIGLSVVAHEATRRVLNQLVQEGLIRMQVERAAGENCLHMRNENIYRRNARRSASEKEV